MEQFSPKGGLIENGPEAGGSGSLQTSDFYSSKIIKSSASTGLSCLTGSPASNPQFNSLEKG